MMEGRRLRFAVTEHVEKSDGSPEPYLGLEGIVSGLGALVDRELPIKEATDSVRFRPGDVLFGKLRPYLAKAWHADRHGTATGELLVMRPAPEIDSRYLTYLALSRPWLDWAGVSAYGAKMPRTSWEALRDFRLPNLTRDRQRAIADFLDRETAEIDAVITKQEELIRLLGERRSAVIAHAVTKGLNPHAPVKDSGVEWLGEVPEHWGVKRLSWIFGLISSGTTPANEEQLEEGGDHYWVTTSELRERPILSTRRMVSAETVEALSPLKLYPPGTLLIAMYGATIGRLGMLEVEACTNQACCALAEPQGVLPEFAMYALLAARDHLLVLASGGGQPNINQDKLRSLRIPVPPVDEQDAVIRHLNKMLHNVDAVVTRTQESIALMQERRAALISDAVTGRLDIETYGRAERESVA